MALIHYNFNSAVLNTKTDVMVILPDVDWAGNLNGKYQSLYLLHGGGEDYTSYIRYTNIETWANEKKLAVITPSAGASSYLDMLHGPRYYTYLSEELPLVMQHVFPLSREKKDHFLLGFSMGAMGAMHWGFDRPDFFNAVGFMSGGGFFEDASSAINPGVPKPEYDICANTVGGADRWKGSEGDPLPKMEKMVREVPSEQWPRFFSTSGKKDFMLPGAIRFADYAKSLGVDIEFHAGAGGHEWYYWNEWIPKILDWFKLKGTLV